MERMTGIYVELVFLDGFLNFGQGLFTFAIFGLDAKYVLMPLQKWMRRKLYGQDSLILPDWEDLDEETKRHCQQFLKHHISNCKKFYNFQAFFFIAPGAVESCLFNIQSL